ncbi:MAG: hypothetical protein D6712_21865 [Chloroflexi bacterium]|nr:MAG: hypothetical protein D6712_21865 [Chloroflexota bacterium]
MNIKCNFFIVGAPKCGTTAWANYLATHPNICFARPKEPHYFNTDMPGFRWAQSGSEYNNYFSHYNGETVVAEASPQYLFSRTAARNIFEYNPHAKILILLRDPYSFLRSYHNQLLLNGDEDISSFEEAWRAPYPRSDGEWPRHCREPMLLDYRSCGKFSIHIKRFLDIFGPRQVKIMKMEDWSYNPLRAYAEILNFLGLEDDGRREFPKIHKARSERFRLAHSLYRHPPRLLRSASRIVRRVPIFGVSLHTMARTAFFQIGTKGGYKSNDDALLRREIQEYFKNDQVMVASLQASREERGET